MTYSSQVKDVLIPYTTREDSFHYYEERNYVNDVNREHTEVLQTYDRELKARETYTYGNGRTSYLNNETGKHYHYLTNQAGSVTGLTQDGNPVASSSYNLYGSTKASTDTTGNPFAYNGEARDITGFDYLRARYYDSSAGTFLTEDSYQGELTDPLSQNLYSYVHNNYSYVENNPVNYTDPSGHSPMDRSQLMIDNSFSGRHRYNSPRPLINQKDGTLYAPTTQEGRAHQAIQERTGIYQYTPIQTRIYPQRAQQAPSSSYHTQQQQAQARAQAEQRRHQAVRDEYAQATGIKDAPKSREGQNLLRNWGEALAKTLKHVCTTAERVGKQIVKAAKKIDWKKVAVTAGAIGVGIALTVATGGLGAPVAMAIGGAASGAIMFGYDAYSSGQRGWGLFGSVVKGAGTGALAGFIGGHFVGAGAGLATNLTQNIGHQTVRQVAQIGVEAAVETAIDTGIDLATGNQITGQTVAMNFAFNTFTNGAGSASAKKGAKAVTPKSKLKADIVNPYTGVREASQYLQEQGVPREYRKQILESFEIRTINVNQADSNTFGLRFYGGNANQEGRYLFETFTDLTNRKNLALPPSWNTMEGIAQFKLKEGTTYISGRVAPQLSMGPEYVGGATQWYVNDLTNLERLK